MVYAHAMTVNKSAEFNASVIALAGLLIELNPDFGEYERHTNKDTGKITIVFSNGTLDIPIEAIQDYEVLDPKELQRYAGMFKPSKNS